MANLNKVFLIGNLTRDPELRYTPSGTAVTDFGIAVNRRWTSRDGEKREETCFVDMQAWARTAEVISEYCRKGSPIFVEGRLRLETWEGRDGQKRSKLRVVVDNFQFLGAAGGRKAGAAPAGTAPGPRSAKTAPPEEVLDEKPQAEGEPRSQDHHQVDEDIPF